MSGELSTSGTSTSPQDTLLVTKLFIPPVRSNLVPRPRLLERLDRRKAARILYKR